MSKSKPKENTDIQLSCELCPRPTGVVLKLGDLKKKIPALVDLKEASYLHGICPTCQKELDEGCTFFRDASGRCFKVSLEATKSKLKPEYWGKVLQIPAAHFNELIRAWMSGNGADVNKAVPLEPPN